MKPAVHRRIPAAATDHPIPQQRDATTDQLVAELRQWWAEAADWKAQALAW
jgi:hypothetical protein